LEASNEFGPTGEEEHGTNMSGVVLSDLITLMSDLKEGDIVYVREVPKPRSAPKARKAPAKPAASKEKKKPTAKKRVKKNVTDK
jgi:hypothetical protein